jgi:hypothetical protein
MTRLAAKKTNTDVGEHPTIDEEAQTDRVGHALHANIGGYYQYRVS